MLHGTKYLLDQLRRQRGFLDRSCHLFDQGFRDEGIRIGIIARNLFSTTYRNKGSKKTLLTESLTEQLQKINPRAVRIQSHVPDISENCVRMEGTLSHMQVRIHGDGKCYSCEVHCEPQFASHPEDRRFLLWKDWWDQPIYINNENRLTRFDLVSYAVNKDGGAHIDPRVHNEYVFMQQQLLHSVEFEFTNPEKAERVDFKVKDDNIHLCDLRQIGFELQNSADLWNW